MLKKAFGCVVLLGIVAARGLTPTAAAQSTVAEAVRSQLVTSRFRGELSVNVAKKHQFAHMAEMRK